MAISILSSDALLDTNVLTAMEDVDHPRHLDVRRFVLSNQLSVTLYVAPQSLYEYWAVATRPKSVNGLGFTPRDADEDIVGFRVAFTVASDPENLLDEWLTLCRAHSVSGKTAHDARLAAYARLHRIPTLVTLNPRDFARYGLSVVVP